MILQGSPVSYTHLDVYKRQAMAIGDRPALAVGLVGGMIAANGKSGFLGALFAGFLAGYLIPVSYTHLALP